MPTSWSTPRGTYSVEAIHLSRRSRGAPPWIDPCNVFASSAIGRVHFEIPVVNKAGRGLPFVYTLTYDSAVWAQVPYNGTYAWYPVGTAGWGIGATVLQ